MSQSLETRIFHPESHSSVDKWSSSWRGRFNFVKLLGSFILWQVSKIIHFQHIFFIKLQLRIMWIQLVNQVWRSKVSSANNIIYLFYQWFLISLQCGGPQDLFRFSSLPHPSKQEENISSQKRSKVKGKQCVRVLIIGLDSDSNSLMKFKSNCQYSVSALASNKSVSPWTSRCST